ncbi:P22 phage major capsid protein family protein, partial [Salmonella enterica]|uniref:P22 phage major capsid protein family protein n=1 Tax=Salmonella enterica TaxID=28901 RepID=UPI000C22D46D
MALENSNFKNFIPQLWSARLLQHLDNSLVAQNFVNNEYEGEISQYGDTVNINQIGNVSIKDYTGSNIDSPEELSSEQQKLVIDQAKYFNFQVKDVDEAQSNVALLDASMQRAGYNMANLVDQDIFSTMADNAGIQVATVSVTSDNTFEELVKLSVRLNQKNVPKSGRRIALPSYAIGFLVLDPRFNRDDQVRDDGYVGRAAGFDIYESN